MPLRMKRPAQAPASWAAVTCLRRRPLRSGQRSERSTIDKRSACDTRKSPGSASRLFLLLLLEVARQLAEVRADVVHFAGLQELRPANHAAVGERAAEHDLIPGLLVRQEQ